MASIEYKVEKLSASNYSTWKTVIKSQLKSKDLWEYVIEPKAEDDKEVVKNEQAKTIMYVSMEANQIAATGVCNTAYDLWQKIRENHEGAATNLRSQSLAEFLSIKYRKNESIIAYAGRFENLLGRLESTGYKADERTKLWAFSNSLPQHMKTTVQMFEMANPKGMVSELISQMKCQHHVENDTDRQDAAYHTEEVAQQSEYRNNYNRSNTITCNYCRKQGHVWKECRKLKADNDRKRRTGQVFHRLQNQHQIQNRNQYRNPQQQGSNQRDSQTRSTKHTGAFNVGIHGFSEGMYSWIVDSGASSHMTPHREFLSNYIEFEAALEISVGDGGCLVALGSGTMDFTSGAFEGQLKNALWIPDLTENLFSLTKAIENSCDVKFDHSKSKVFLYRNNDLVLEGEKKPGSIYFLITMRPSGQQMGRENGALLGATYEEWHKRLCHCSLETVKALAKSNAVDGLRIVHKEQDGCEACVHGKICRSHHPSRSQIRATEKTAVLHLDTVGRFRATSLGGARYLLVATEEYSGFMFFEALSTKNLIPSAVKRLVNQAELESKRDVKSIVTDNGTEFVNGDLQKWTFDRGIVHRFSAPYTPEQNGRAERSNRTILDGVRTLLANSKLPEELWAEAVNTVVYTANRIPTKKNPTKTRYELLKGIKPDISNLRVFGQKAIIRESDNAREGKLAPRGQEVTFVGYTDRHNTYRFYTDHPIQQIVVSCDVAFIRGPVDTAEKATQEQYVTTINDTENADTVNKADDTDDREAGDICADIQSFLDSEKDYATSQESPADSSDDDTVTDVLTPLLESIMTRSRAKSANKRNNPDTRSNQAELFSNSPQGAMFTLINEPRTVTDARNGEDWELWRRAMDEEMEALHKNNTWVLVDRIPNVKTIKNRWVYKLKLDFQGQPERHKARLVAKGYTQVPDVDYKETYAPVASMSTVRLFLAIVNQNRMRLMQFDVKTAFLYGDLEEELFMEQPEGYVKDSNKICKLNKSLYGLKQAPRQWNKKFEGFLKAFELQQSEVDRCLYYNRDRSILLALYVDDGLVAGEDEKQLNRLISYLKANFELKVMDCKSFLGLEIFYNLHKRTLSISQSNYVDKILERFKFTDCTPVSTPEVVGARFEESIPLPNDNQFKELVGSLLYLTTCTRPDIAHAVSMASRTAQPTQAHWVALKRILRYLKGTKDLGILFRWEHTNQLIGYSDADYANDAETRRSTTGICIFYGGAPVAWRCQRQPIITLSTTEAEYVAGCDLVKEILPLRQQLIDLNQLDPEVPTKVYIDNQSAVRIASNESGQNRTKHIDIREKWLTEQVSKKKIIVEHISGNEQAADILTKPLYKSKYIANRSKLLTQVVTGMMMMMMCCLISNGRELKLTDPITPTHSEYHLLKGDTRYRVTNIFLNPCDHLFNYSNSVTTTRQLIKYCYEYYSKKHLDSLPNCKRLPTLGPDLTDIPLTYNCQESPNNGLTLNDSYMGKCDITRRESKNSRLQSLELDQLYTAWNKHRQQVKGLPTIRRAKRIIPAVLMGIGIIGLITGPLVSTHQLSRVNRDNIETIANITDVHSRIMQDSTNFLDEYRNSVSVLHNWAEEVEERLGDDPMLSKLSGDPVFRGKKANLVKSYMQWFETQEQLLADINREAAKKRVSSKMKNMLNGTSNFDQLVNMSTLFECTYRLENKSLVLDLEFNLPLIDENIEILKILATDVYAPNINTSGETVETCWETYMNSRFMIHNKTNGCIKSLNENRLTQTGVRGQTCSEPVNELYDPDQRNKTWFKDICYREVPLLSERIQITEIDGAHKIYCHPFTIELENEILPCPNNPFILEAHAYYRIGNITHEGAYVDTTISRRTRAAENRSKRYIRSPILPPNLQSSTTNASQMTTQSKPVSTDLIGFLPRTKIGESLKNLTNQMNVTIASIKLSLTKLPAKLNLTRADIDTFLDKPIETLLSGYNMLSDYLKSFSSMLSCAAILMIIVIIMPAIEVLIFGLKIAKIPANMWLRSAKRVSNKLKYLSSPKQNKLIDLFSKKRKKNWDDVAKVV